MIDIDDLVNSYSGTGYGYNPSIVSKSQYQYASNMATSSYNQLIIQGCSDFSQWVSVDRDLGTLVISSVVSPGQTGKDTDEFIVTMYKDSGYQYQIATSVLSSGANTNTAMKIRNMINTKTMVLNYLLPITDYTIEKSTDFKVSFNITKNLYKDSIIEIKLPDGVMVGATGSCQIYYMTSNININAYCDYVNGTAGSTPSNPSVITIHDAFTSSSSDYWAIDISANPDNKLITFFINSIINPASTSNAATWYVNTKNYLAPPGVGVANYNVDQGNNGVSYTPVRGQLFSTSTGLTSDSYQTSNTQRVYTFAIKFSNNIPAGGYLNFKFPSDFQIDTSSCQFSIPSTTIAGISSFSSC